MTRFAFSWLLAAVLLVSSSLVRAEDCQCSPETQRVTYIVVEMPDPQSTQSSLLSTPTPIFSKLNVKPTATAHTVPTKPTNFPTEGPFVEPPKPDTHPDNTTHTFGPCSAPGIDRSDPINIVPAQNVSLYYSSSDEEEPGSIGMNLTMNNPTVVLEHIDSISNVICNNLTVTVLFENLEGFNEAVKDWSDDEAFVLITNHMGNCNAALERGFFLASGVSSNAEKLAVTVKASRKELASIAESCEMAFTSLPAASLTRRLVLDPSVSLSFAEGLPENTVLFSDGQYIDVTAEEAWFQSTITFSGYLKYNFWRFRLEHLYFDLDANFASSAAVSAEIRASFAETIRYSPDVLAWSLVEVPGIVSLGPGIAFGLALDVEATAAVGLHAGVDVNIPAGNVHVDLLDGSKSGTSGWEPQYNSYANISQAADVRLDVGADVTVQLAFKLLGGLVDLSSGVTASPGIANKFKLRGEQDAWVGGTGAQIDAGFEVPKDGLVCAETNGVEFASDFYFNVSAFATKFWQRDLYNVRVPLWDVCYSF
ncbi:hypothetical protein VD0004_g7085 [Verticillium dahliae]|nr:hypothetical protein VD0004_g7085 [Verticillium dahliae]PNH66879.1 hypothetical protein VD0001_g8026 [Verticillium dahliae]